MTIGKSIIKQVAPEIHVNCLSLRLCPKRYLPIYLNFPQSRKSRTTSRDQPGTISLARNGAASPKKRTSSVWLVHSGREEAKYKRKREGEREARGREREYFRVELATFYSK